MNAIVKLFSAGACFLVVMCVEINPEAPLKLGFSRDAEAIIGVAPGGSVVRRHAVVGAAVVTTTAVAASSANASAAAAQQAKAAPPPPAAAAPGGPPPVGTIVTTLPPGCAETMLNNVEYHRCGSTYYRASMQGSNLVFVVSQP